MRLGIDVDLWHAVGSRDDFFDISTGSQCFNPIPYLVQKPIDFCCNSISSKIETPLHIHRQIWNMRQSIQNIEILFISWDLFRTSIEWKCFKFQHLHIGLEMLRAPFNIFCYIERNIQKVQVFVWALHENISNLSAQIYEKIECLQQMVRKNRNEAKSL